MKKIAFTICSNNYVAQAKVLFHSLYQTNPDYKLVLGLVDKMTTKINYCLEDTHIEVVEVEKLRIPDEYDIFRKYNIIELNTSVKASYIKYIQKNMNADIILYFDPDIKVFSSLSFIEDSLLKKSIVLTPHVLNPIPLDNLWPNEGLFISRGIYNLGFIGISFIDSQVFDFLDWWEERLLKQCFSYVSRGLFVDQLPITIAPILFHKITAVMYHSGMNVAPWNLHERKLTQKDSNYFFNNEELIFFHFSNMKFQKGKSQMYSRYEVYPLLENFYGEYENELKRNRFFDYNTLKCYYKVKKLKIPLWKKIIRKLCILLLDKLSIQI